MLPLCFIVFASGAALFVYAIGHLERGENALGGFLLVVAILGYIAGIIALSGLQGAQAAGSAGAHPLRPLCRHPAGAGLLLGLPFCTAVNPAAGTN